MLKGTPPSGCLDLSLRFLEVNCIYYCTFLMDGIKILPRNENCEIFGWSRHTTVKTCLHRLPKSFFDDVWVNKIRKWVFAECVCLRYRYSEVDATCGVRGGSVTRGGVKVPFPLRERGWVV